MKGKKVCFHPNPKAGCILYNIYTTQQKNRKHFRTRAKLHIIQNIVTLWKKSCNCQ